MNNSKAETVLAPSIASTYNRTQVRRDVQLQKVVKKVPNFFVDIFVKLARNLGIINLIRLIKTLQ